MRYLSLVLLLISSLGYSAGKDQLPAFTLLAAGDMSGNITSDPVDVRGWDNVDFQLNYTSTPVGTFSVECTLDNVTLMTPIWTALTLSPAPAASGAAANILIEVNQTGCSYLRVKYTRTSSSGTLAIRARAKMI